MRGGASGRRSIGEEIGLTRRDLLRRGAVVGGTLLWVAPTIQTIAPRAYAAFQVGSFRSCCQCDGTGQHPAGCTVDVITYDECLARCGPSSVAHYGVGNYDCVDGNCVSLDAEGESVTGATRPTVTGATGPTGPTGAAGVTGSD